MSIARKREYHESQRLSISRTTKLCYITTATPSISRLRRSQITYLSAKGAQERSQLCQRPLTNSLSNLRSKSRSFALKLKVAPNTQKQLIRSASSISANIAEAKYAESNADFVHKLEIAQKEANETENWLSVLFKSGIIDELTFKSLRNKCGKIRRMLIASITTVKAKTNVDK